MAVSDLITSKVVGALTGEPEPTGAYALTDVKAFVFKTKTGVVFDLSGALLGWNDSLLNRLATHQYLKRHGAEQEPMGRQPGRFTMRLAFFGAEWAKQYRAFVAAIGEEPRGTMDHPVLGTMPVACEGIQDAAVNPAQELDCVNLTVVFVEDAVDAIRKGGTFKGPSARKAKIDSMATSITGAVAGLATSLAIAEDLAVAAVNFSTAASQSLNESTPDPSLPMQLAMVAIRVDRTQAAVRSDQAASRATASSAPAGSAAVALSSHADAASFDVLAMCQQLYAECVALAASASAARASPIRYTVPMTMHVATLCATFYGADGAARIDEVLALNRIPRPYAIRSGTVLTLPAPTN